MGVFNWCWWSGHIWISDRPISLNGKFAILAGLWSPAATCSRCGKKYEGINTKYAQENGWIAETPNESSRCRILV